MSEKGEGSFKNGQRLPLKINETLKKSLCIMATWDLKTTFTNGL